MDRWKFEWFVTYGRLYMPLANRLGDPFEGTAPRGEIEWWDQAIAEAATSEQKAILEHNKNFLARFRASFRDNIYYVSCWHMSAFENGAMWPAYTTSLESVAIRTTYRALQEALPSFVLLGMVRYIDYSCERLPSMNLFEAIMHKDQYYAFEREMRAVATPPAVPELGLDEFRADHFESENKPGVLVYAPTIDVGKLVHGVVLHPKATADFEQRMEHLCTANSLPRPERSRVIRTPMP